MKKTFNEKLQNDGDLPKIVFIKKEDKAVKIYGEGKLLIAPPRDYSEIMGKIPKGKILTSKEIREFLAKKYGADNTCQLTAGIFINIAAWASEERDVDKIPYWRTLKKDGELNEKYPDGIEGQKFILENEGFEIIQKGKKYFVKEYKKYLFDIELSHS